MDTPTRLLRLLSLLSARAFWSAADLAAETETTERTVRRDITRLRELGYPVESTTGRHGGYTLGRAGKLPPLMLDDDEAVAVSIALRSAAGGAGGTEWAALSALSKLDQVLPPGLREQVDAVATMTVALRDRGLPAVDVGPLVTAALACRRSERLRFSYSDASDRFTDRLVEPYRVVYTDRRWYLVAFDVDRDDWRTFRVDRMAELHLTGARFTPMTDPPDAAALVSRGVAVAVHDLHAHVRLFVTRAEAAEMIAPTAGVIEPDAEAEDSVIVVIGGDADWIARYLVGLDCRFEVLDPPEVRAELAAIGRRLIQDHR